MINLLHATPGHADEIFRLYEAVKVAGKTQGTTDWDEHYPTKDILDDDIRSSNLYMYIVDGEIVGTVTMIPDFRVDISPYTWIEPDACFLTRLCVSPEHQNKGIGEFIMLEITRYAQSLKIPATHHLASSTNLAATRLYERMNYDKRGLVHIYDHDYYAYEMLTENIAPA